MRILDLPWNHSRYPDLDPGFKPSEVGKGQFMKRKTEKILCYFLVMPAACGASSTLRGVSYPVSHLKPFLCLEAPLTAVFNGKKVKI